MGERGLQGAWSAAAGMAALGLLLVASGSAGTVLATPISNDPYTNSSSQHKTQVEADSFAFGNTIVATFQTGRFTNGGASNLAWSTSTEQRADVDDGHASGHDCLRGWAVVADERSGRRLRPRARRLDDLGSRHRRVGQRCGHPDQPFDRRRPHVAEPGHGRHCARDLLRQELDCLRHLGVEPSLRQLLHAMGRRRCRLPDHDEHVHRRRPHVEPNSAAGRQCPPASAASRSSSRTGM